MDPMGLINPSKFTHSAIFTRKSIVIVFGACFLDCIFCLDLCFWNFNPFPSWIEIGSWKPPSPTFPVAQTREMSIFLFMTVTVEPFEKKKIWMSFLELPLQNGPITHRIHGAVIFTYMNGWFFMVNVGKYTIQYMDPMGQSVFLFSLGIHRHILRWWARDIQSPLPSSVSVSQDL